MRKTHGQSIIEYTVLAMLIIVGTIVMGPYLIRSINAQFKLWQESIDDSTNDRMQQGGSINIASVDCHANPLTNGGCGARGNVKQCKPNERYQYTPCTIGTCCYGKDFSETCTADPTCCDEVTSCSGGGLLTGCCGTTPINPIITRTPDANGYLPPIYPTAPLNPTDDCYYGEELQIGICNGMGVSPDKYICQSNSNCKPKCLGDVPTDDTTGDPLFTVCNNTGLTQDTN
ncbi:MAG: hypothetical protein HQL15_08020, partial [Candidatus Omnitrophica bacterium]|nr:hypothetical protein [Candidatus Omnitrophota bacterium]